MILLGSDKESRIRETLTLSTGADNSIVKKQKNTFGSDLEHLPVFKALRRADPEQNAGTIHKSKPEHLLVLKAPRGDDPRVQSGTPPCF